MELSIIKKEVNYEDKHYECIRMRIDYGSFTKDVKLDNEIYSLLTGKTMAQLKGMKVGDKIVICEKEV